MEIKINLDSSSKSDVHLAELLGLSIQASMRLFREEIMPATSSNDKADADEPVEEASVVEEKPKKRTTRKKAKEEEPPVESAEEPAKAEEKAEVPNDSDLPFDNEPEEEPKAEAPKEEAPKFPTMTKDEFTAINKAKREELGLTVTGEHADLIRDFNVFCQKHAEAEYGNPKPSTLLAEELWQFAQWFQNIKLNPDYVAGSADEEHGNPFVSNAPSNI